MRPESPSPTQTTGSARRQILPMDKVFLAMTMPGLTRWLKLVDATVAVACATAAPVFFYFGHHAWAVGALGLALFNLFTYFFEPYRRFMESIKRYFVR